MRGSWRAGWRQGRVVGGRRSLLLSVGGRKRRGMGVSVGLMRGDGQTERDVRGNDLLFLGVDGGRGRDGTHAGMARSQDKASRCQYPSTERRGASRSGRLTFLSLATRPSCSNRCLCCLLFRILEYCFAFTYSGSSSCSSSGRTHSSGVCDCLANERGSASSSSSSVSSSSESAGAAAGMSKMGWGLKEWLWVEEEGESEWLLVE